MDERAELTRFGKRFRQVREQQGTTVVDLAARRGIAAQRISALEAGRLDPAYDVMIALADGMGVALSTLVPED